MRFTYIFILLVAYSCSLPNNHPKEEFIKRISIDLDHKSDFLFTDSTISEVLSVFQLEETDSIIREIKYICAIGDKYLIYQTRRLPLQIIDSTGKIINQIGSIGEDEKKYVVVKDIFISNDTIYISEIKNQKIVTYKTNGEFIRTYFLNKWLLAVRKVGKQYLGVTGCINHMDKGYVELFDSNFNSIKGLIKNVNKRQTSITNYLCSDNESNIYFHYSFDNHIYQYVNDSLKPYYLIDFGNKNKFNFIGSGNKRYSEKEYTGFIYNVYLLKHYLFFDFNHYSGGENETITPYRCCYDLSNDTYSFIEPNVVYFVTEDKMITVVYPSKMTAYEAGKFKKFNLTGNNPILTVRRLK